MDSVVTTVYLDVLVLLNIFVNYFLFQATARLVNQKIPGWRLLLGTVLGGLYSLIILLELTAAELTAIKIMMGVSLIFVVFFTRKGGDSRSRWLRFGKTSLCFFLVNFIFAGFMQALWMFAAPCGMAYKNGVPYFDVSALTLAASTIAAYLIITLVTYLLNRRNRGQDLREIILSLDGRQVTLTGFLDTGNKLCDVFTGLPVAVCQYDSVRDLLPEKIRGFFQSPGDYSFDRIEDSRLKTMIRMIPVNAVNGAGSLPGFRPDEALIGGVSRRIIVAVTDQPLSDGEFQAILPGTVE